MSTTAVSSSSIFQELQSFYQNRQGDLKQLGSALQSGDLSGAQQAFNDLAALGQGGPFANSEPFGKASRAQAFDTLGQALQSGDLAGAQAAFAALTAKPGSSQSTPATVVNLSGTQNIEPPTSDSSSIYQQRHEYRQQRKADIAQLGKDLQAGDLTAAQQDVANLTALGQSGPNKNGQVFQRTDRSQDFQDIAQAVQSGDLAGAQSAFANLQSTYGSNHVPEPPIHQPPVFTTPPTIQPPVAEPPLLQPPLFTGPPVTQPPVFTTPPTTQPPVSVPPNSQPPVFTTPPTTQPPVFTTPPTTQPPTSVEQITININQQQNYELILNLNLSSTSEAQASSSLSLNVNA
jgi:hypothetical protein